MLNQINDSSIKNNIKCISCRFARVDKSLSGTEWTAYECSNINSEYYMALLNINPNGGKKLEISWTGCEHGEYWFNLDWMCSS